MPATAVSPAPRLWALPAKQLRSRETRDRLLVSGRMLLDQGVFEQTTVAGLAQMAACSVGSFYSRFPDKEAFYREVMAAAEDEILNLVRHRLDADSVGNLSAMRTVDACVDLLIDMMSAYRGLITTVQHKSMRDKPAIRPLQRIGLRIVEHFSAIIEAKYGERDNAVFRRNIAVAFQMAFSILMMGILNTPPVLNAQSPDYRFWIKEIVSHSLGVRDAPVAQDECGTGVTAAAPRRPRAVVRQAGAAESKVAHGRVAFLG